MLTENGRDKAREYALKIVSTLSDEQKSLAFVLVQELLADAYMQGRWDRIKEQRQLIKELLHDIKYTGFSMDSVKLTLDDWLEE